jgi:phospholipid/cholesterol/gamma-HCH transport system substrate-binding protein
MPMCLFGKHACIQVPLPPLGARGDSTSSSTLLNLLSSRRQRLVFFQGSVVPSRKDIQWSQLKVGSLVLVALAALVFIIFRMSASTGGLFAKKINLICYFNNASGLAPGAPVTLEGVTIGNVGHIRVVPGHNPDPVEVIMIVGEEFVDGLHTDSLATITQAGVLGNSYVDIDSTHATGPPPVNGTVLQASGTPTLQDVIGGANSSITDIHQLIKRVDVLIDTLNSNRGTIGRLINDRQMADKLDRTTENLEAITAGLRDGKGTIGKLLTDPTIYNRANDAVKHLDNISAAIDSSNGTLGKAIHDPTLYNNINRAVKNTNELLAQINSGKGAIGEAVKDPAFAKKLDDTVTQLDTILANLNAGKGSAGQLLKNRSLYDHLDATSAQAEQLIRSIRQDPKKYMVIRLKLF